MNENDSDIVQKILLDQKMKPTSNEEEFDVILFNTCAIRENAEQKVW